MIIVDRCDLDVSRDAVVAVTIYPLTILLSLPVNSLYGVLYLFVY